ncbi:MAG: serine hydrolase [Thermoanaerobaculia bacterium]|nr:serine hydrolase [Thermoanaerobaculia bacterium]
MPTTTSRARDLSRSDLAKSNPSKPRWRQGIAIALALALVVTLAGLVFAAPRDRSLDSLMDLYAKQGQREGVGSPFNGVLLVAKGDEVIHKKAYGFYDRETAEPLAVADRFPIGSITKQFTAMLVMQQVEAGILELDRSVSDYLAYVSAEFGGELTLHRLLSHSAGLPHYEGLRGLIDDREFLETRWTPEEYVRLISRVELINEPGTEFSYSSLGYVLLGAILEEATQTSYAELLQEEIVKPLGLRNTGFANNQFLDDGVAQGYRFRELGFFKSLRQSAPGEYSDDRFRDQSTTFSTGGIHSTVEDLWRWSRAVHESELLSPESTERMLEPNIGGYAYGWFRNLESAFRRNPSAPQYAHGGALEGHRSNLAVYDDGTTIIFLSNVTPVNVLRLTHNLHLIANGIQPGSFRRDLVRPEIEDDLATFVAEGGQTAFVEYYDEISRRAGYTVLPAQLAYVELATLYIEERQLLEAEEVLTELDSHYSRLDQSIVNRIGYLLLKQNYNDEAIRYFERNVVTYPHSPNVHDSLGEALLDSGQLDLAVKSFREAVRLAEASEHRGLDAFQANLDKALGKS